MTDVKNPIVAIVGRPNVGKSSLFNTLIGRKKSLVSEVAGVTRDVVNEIYTDKDLGYTLELLDTGGISHTIEHPFIKETIAFANIAIEKANILLFVVDAKNGITQDDLVLADLFRKNRYEDTYLVVNKVDNNKAEIQAFEFYELGFDKVFFVSCAHRLGIIDLKESIQTHLDKTDYRRCQEEILLEKNSEEENPFLEVDVNAQDFVIKCALLGKPNAGKSSFFNRIIGEERAIVSDIPGTTRDVLSEQIKYKQRIYQFADMAGLRRRTKIVDEIEQDSIKKALWAIRKSDVVILLIDSSLKEVTEQDKKLLSLTLKEKKAVVIGLNKWDLIPQEDRKIILERFKYQLDIVRNYPTVPFSVTKGKSIYRILDITAQVVFNYYKKLKARELTLFLKELIKEKPPFSKLGTLKIFYGAQVGKTPPQFEIFVNNKEIITPSYKRYLINSIYSHFDMRGVPLFLTFKNRH